LSRSMCNPSRTAATDAEFRLPEYSTKSALSTVTICDTLTTLVFERPASPFFSGTLPGALAPCVRLSCTPGRRELGQNEHRHQRQMRIFGTHAMIIGALQRGRNLLGQRDARGGDSVIGGRHAGRVGQFMIGAPFSNVHQFNFDGVLGAGIRASRLAGPGRGARSTYRTCRRRRDPSYIAARRTGNSRCSSRNRCRRRRCAARGL
jgi:hypothetical protein